MTTLIDTNVLIYLIDPVSPFHDRAEAAFIRCKQNGPIIINDIVYTEFSMGMADKAATDAVIEDLELERLQMNDDALYEAGQVCKAYRENNNNARNKPLPDHYIGAHAKVIGASLLTLNSGDFRHIAGLIIEDMN